jgi:hypothetical protein
VLLRFTDETTEVDLITIDHLPVAECGIGVHAIHADAGGEGVEVLAIPTLTDGKNELFSWGFLSVVVVVGVNYGPF